MDRLRIVAGCPLKDREWIINKWIWHLDHAVSELDQEVDLTLLFVGDKNDSTAISLMPLIEQGAVIYEYVDEATEDPGLQYKRAWSKHRYQHMVFLRNALLGRVREMNPDYFLSIDSDILVNPASVKHLIEIQRETGAWAVGGKAFMSSSCEAPSYGYWYDPHKKQNFHRKNADEVKKVDVIMAYKLMTPDAYNVNYKLHSTGEDAGWCSQIPRGKLYWDGTIVNKHVMHRNGIDTVDKRCGY